jgi:hypothetical protein
VLLEGVVVLLVGDLAVVDAVLARARGGDGALPLVRLLGVVLEDGLDPGVLRVVALGAGLRVAILLRVAISVPVRVAVLLGARLGGCAVCVDAGLADDAAAVDHVLELVGAQLGRLDAEDEGDGVHAVGLAGAIGADDGGEVRVAEEQRVAPAVGFEVCGG